MGTDRVTATLWHLYDLARACGNSHLIYLRQKQIYARAHGAGLQELAKIARYHRNGILETYGEDIFAHGLYTKYLKALSAGCAALTSEHLLRFAEREKS